MGKILNISDLTSLISNFKRENQTIVLAGGCFDILHIGHIKFLNEAKKSGDILIVFLESDEKVKKLKGNNRPIFTKEERATVLSSLAVMDYIIPLPFLKTDKDYNDLISIIKPDVIAVTENDPLISQKSVQANLVGGKLIIIPFIKTYSSSKLAKLLGIE